MASPLSTRSKTMTDKPVVYFDKKENEWVSTDGQRVCQDHGNSLPCPHNHGRKKS
jgi:hypothetical protein